MNETMVRMGELSVSRDPDHVLASIGLGSCIGLVLLDPDRPVVGLAHIMLPQSNGTESNGNDATVGKFADTAVPALLAELGRVGALRSRLKAVLVGGAHMFSFGSAGLDIGRRNEEATRDALGAVGIRVAAAATGGTKGRTVRVDVEKRVVTVKEPGAAEQTIYGAVA